MSQVNGNFDVKSTDFSNNFAKIGEDADDPKKKKFDLYPGGVFTMPNPNAVAYSNKVGDEGGFNA